MLSSGSAVRSPQSALGRFASAFSRSPNHGPRTAWKLTHGADFHVGKARYSSIVHLPNAVPLLKLNLNDPERVGDVDTRVF